MDDYLFSPNQNRRKQLEKLLEIANFEQDAACKGTDTNKLFYADHDTSEIAEAKKICAGCTVRQECLDYALDNHETYGVWGGLAPKERRHYRRPRRTRSGT